MRTAILILGLLIVALPAHAGDGRTADAVTEPGRGLERALDVVLGGATGKRTIIFLLDPTPSLKSAGFAEAFERALLRNHKRLVDARIGIALVRTKAELRMAPSVDWTAAARTVSRLVAEPTEGFQNVYAAARTAAGAFRGQKGARELVLVTLENGDGEDDPEGTLSALRRSKVRFSTITREAFVSDSFWVSSTRGAPRGLHMGAGDGPYLSLPWGWMFQQTIANEGTPSGFAQYGLSRLAAGTGGRVFLYAAPSGSHRCAFYGSCSFCAEDHRPLGEGFRAHRMAQLAPSIESRAKAGAALARDPHLRALLKLWGQLAKAGLLRSRPSLRLAAGGVKPERRQTGAWKALTGSSLAVSRLAGRADKLVKICDRHIADFKRNLEGLETQAGQTRFKAMADFTLVMLHVTRANLLSFAAWCREVAPVLLGKGELKFAPPEMDPIAEGRRVGGIGYTNLCLCHGVAPFRELHLPGGARFDAELVRLDEVVKVFMRRYAHTPYAIALRHQGLARFYLTYRAKNTTPPPRPQSGSSTDKPTTETTRPGRAGGPSTGSGSGAPTTGGG